jgi:hypothetical protein
MLLVSLGLHGLLLLLPTGDPDATVIPPPDPEQDSVAITRLPPAATPEQGAELSPMVPNSTAPRAVATSPAPTSAAPPPGATTPTPSSPEATPPRPQPPAAASTQASGPGTPAPAATESTPAASAPSSQNATATPPTATPPSTPPPASSSGPSQPLFDSDVGRRLLSYAAELNLPQGQIDRLADSIRDRFTYDAHAASAAAYTANLNQWKIQLQDSWGITPQAYDTELTVTYYQRACLPESPGPAKVGVVIDPDLEQRRQPVVLQSSGYGDIDRLVANRVRRHRFPATSDLAAYTLEVTTAVNHGQGSCLALSPNP